MQKGDKRELTAEEREMYPDTEWAIVTGAVCTSVEPETWLVCREPAKSVKEN